MQRGKTGDLKWVICNYPTSSLADAANMTVDEYARLFLMLVLLQSQPYI